MNFQTKRETQSLLLWDKTQNVQKISTSKFVGR
jgi:hypothetical protein